VTRAKRVEVTLRAFEKSGDAMLLAERFHFVVATGEQLVRISLVTDVPHDLIARRFEYGMYGDSELNDAESGANVTTRP